MGDLSGYKVHLGGRDRGMRYTADDAVTLEGMFPGPRGIPVGVFDLVQNIFQSEGSRTVLHALLWIGLKRVDSRITMAKAVEWFQKLVDADDKGGIKAVRETIYNAAGASGLAGFKWDELSLDEAMDGEEDAPKAARKS